MYRIYRTIGSLLCITIILSGCKKQPASTETHAHLSAPTVATAVPSACAANIYEQKSPLMPQELSPYTRIICYEQYAVITSGISHTGLFSMEYLSPERFDHHPRLKRVNQFHADDNLPDYWGANPGDYTRSGWDRGHLSPSADMTTPQAQYESFSMANMAPQNPPLNRGLWANIEAAVRTAGMHTPLYVVTGTAYTSPAGQQMQIGQHKVFVPTYYWKAVFSLDGKIHGVYIAENKANGRWMQASFRQCDMYMHAIPFPGLPPAWLDAPPALPTPIDIHEDRE